MKCQISLKEYDFPKEDSSMLTMVSSQKQSQIMSQILFSSLNVHSLRENHHSNIFVSRDLRQHSNLDYQEHFISFDNNSCLEGQISLYKWRAEEQVQVSRVYHLEMIDDNEKIKQLRVITQNLVPIVQSNITLSPEEGITIVTDCLKGFQRIFQKLGNIRVTERMIFITSKKRGRAWINEQIYKNSFDLDLKGNEASVIKIITSVVKGKIENSKLVQKFISIIQNSLTFSKVLRNIQKYLIQSNSFRNIKTFSQKSSRKYFKKSPDYKVVHQTTKQIQNKQNQGSSFSKLKSSMNYPTSPKIAGLTFKSKENILQSKNKKITRFNIKDDQSKTILNKFQSQNPSSEKIDIAVQHLSKNFSNPYLVFSSNKNVQSYKNIKNHANYFTTITFLHPKSYNNCQGKSKESGSSKNCSFRSIPKNNQKKNYKQSNTLRPPNIFRQYHIKRTGSTTHQSPDTFIRNLTQNRDALKLRQDRNVITKSMALIKNESPTIGNLEFKESLNMSARDFIRSSKETFEQKSTLPEKKRNTLMDYKQIKTIDSFIQKSQSDNSKSGTQIIEQLKHSVFNRLDDLKQSQIILQDKEENSLRNSRASIVQDLSKHLQFQNRSRKHLRKMINKPMAQSITIKALGSQIGDQIKLPRSHDGRSVKNQKKPSHSPPSSKLLKFRFVKQSVCESKL